MSLIHNERTKLTAVLINTVASAVFVAGVVAPFTRIARMTELELYAWYGSPIVAFLACYVLYLIARQGPSKNPEPSPPNGATSAEKIATSAEKLMADLSALAAEIERVSRRPASIKPE